MSSAPAPPAAWPVEPVLVLGAGPVGQTTALLLARWGVPSIVLDQRPRRDDVGSKAICQQRDVLDVWEAVGVGRRIADEGVTWRTARTFHRGTELFAVELAEPGRPAFPPFVNISQTRTELLLDERIAAEPLVDLRWGHRVTALDQDGTGVTVTCADGPRVRGSYLVLCSGARSDELRHQLGVRFEGHSFDDRFLICDIRTDMPGWATERRFYFDPDWNRGRQVLIHPCPDSTFRIDWQVPPDYDLDDEAASGALDARIRQVIGERGYEIVWKSVYRFHSRLADRMRRGRVLIAGDAAHLVSPFGARGLNSGVGDAENAAWKIAYAGRGWAPDALLDTYHDERHAAARENIAVTTATMDFLVPPDGERARYRADVLARAAADPAARALVDSGRLAEPFWYVDSPLTTADARRPFGGRPPRGQAPPAGPGVLVPDAPVRGAGCPPRASRFRELARDGFLLLATPEADLDAARAAATAAPGPVRVLALGAIDASGALAAALDARPAEVWVLRPDAHVAAVLADPTGDDVRAALARAAARSTTTRAEEDRHGVLPASR
ncbi:FAD-dependent monooxygenase [Pseudonocardia kunmingensis]|uniref:Pentachlorophenol monooxygenase/3-(3-hydroxy-phenyl)propionate hydroxylase n=1 Tax=Pseudonocardia kunmingensis TaxID=630975 RepID=A0A543DQT0_9PSEU|nr:FAD-dependent monooxygenase [Pseudonocardia kunmingensis]TQM11683.1 pentachlorophenol monooxygenase/3-(3-hydroxy-phenyl)propionate hydroxylase [Pseudonocardia kunmingensis]